MALRSIILFILVLRRRRTTYPDAPRMTGSFARRPSPQATVALNSRAHSGRIAPRWRRRSAVLGQNRRLASPCRAAEGKHYQQEADELNPRHGGFHVHR